MITGEKSIVEKDYDRANVYIDEIICKYMQSDDLFYAITPSMADVGFLDRIKQHKNYFDVGICEEHAIAEATALSKINKKPIIGTHSTFYQRMFDSILNVAIPNNANILVLLHECGINDGALLQEGIYDIAMNNVASQNITQYFPYNIEELQQMLIYCMDNFNGINVIRIPKNIQHGNIEDIIERDSDIVICGIGDFCNKAKQLSDKFVATFIPIKDTKSMDCLDKYILDNKMFVILENGIKNGSYATMIFEYIHNKNKSIDVMIYGIDGIDFSIHTKSITALLNDNNINVEQIAKDIQERNLK